MMIYSLARVQDLAPPVYRIPAGHTYESALFQALERRMAELEDASGEPYLQAFHGSFVFIMVMVLKKARAPKSTLDDATMLAQLTTGLFRSAAVGGSGVRPFVSELRPALQLLALGAIQEHLDPLEAAARIARRIEALVRALPAEVVPNPPTRERVIAFEVMTKQVFTPLLRQAFRWLADTKARYALLKSLAHVRHESSALVPCHVHVDEAALEDFRGATSLDHLESASSVFDVLDRGRKLRMSLEDQAFWGEFTSRVPAAVILAVDQHEFVSTIFVRTLCVLALTDAGPDDWLLPRPFSAVLTRIRDRAAGLTTSDGTLVEEAVQARYSTVREYVMTRIAQVANRPIPEGVEARIHESLCWQYKTLLADVSEFVRNGKIFAREAGDRGLLYEPKPNVFRLRSSTASYEEELSELRDPKLTMRRLEELFRFWIKKNKEDVVVALRHRTDFQTHENRLQIAAPLFAAAYHRLETPWSAELEREYTWMLGAVAEVPALLGPKDPPFPKPYVQLILAADTEASADGRGAKYLVQLARLAETIFPQEITRVGHDVADAWFSGHVSSIAHLLCFAHFGEGFYGVDFRSIKPAALAATMMNNSAWISLLTSERLSRAIPKLRSKLTSLLAEVRAGSRIDASETSVRTASAKKPKKISKKITKKRA